MPIENAFVGVIIKTIADTGIFSAMGEWIVASKGSTDRNVMDEIWNTK